MGKIKTQSRSIITIAKTEYINWLLNPRMILLLCYFIIISNVIVDPMWDKYYLMGREPMNIFEPYIAVMNSSICILVAPLGLLLVTYDYPKITKLDVFTIVRSGRMQWLFGQVLFALISSLTISLMILMYMLFQMGTVSFFKNEWSVSTLDFISRYPQLSTSAMAELLPPNVYYHSEPVESAIYSFFVNEAYYVLIMLVMLVIKIKKGGVFSILSVVIILGGGYASLYFGGIGKWIFPMAHTIEHLHFSRVLRIAKMPIEVSILYFVILILIVFTIALINVRNINFMELDE